MDNNNKQYKTVTIIEKPTEQYSAEKIPTEMTPITVIGDPNNSSNNSSSGSLDIRTTNNTQINALQHNKPTDVAPSRNNRKMRKINNNILTKQNSMTNLDVQSQTQSQSQSQVSSFEQELKEVHDRQAAFAEQIKNEVWEQPQSLKKVIGIDQKLSHIAVWRGNQNYQRNGIHPSYISDRNIDTNPNSIHTMDYFPAAGRITISTKSHVLDSGIEGSYLTQHIVLNSKIEIFAFLMYDGTAVFMRTSENPNELRTVTANVGEIPWYKICDIIYDEKDESINIFPSGATQADGIKYNLRQMFAPTGIATKWNI